MLMTMQWLRWTVGLCLLAAFLVVMPADNVRADCFEDEEYAEAVKQTEDQWKAVRQTMQDGVSRYEEFLKNYAKYKNIVFSQDMEKSIILVKRVFGMSNATEQQAKDMVWKLRDQFNRLDKAGLRGKLQSAIGQLKKADKIAGELENTYQFAQKSHRTQTDVNGRYQLLMKGEVNSRVTIEATAAGYEPYASDGRMPAQTILGNDIFLAKVMPAQDSAPGDQAGDDEVPAFITRSKPKPSEPEPSPDADSGPDDVRAVATETERVNLNGVVLERIINEDSLTVVRRVDGEDKMLTGKAAVDVLLREGYLQRVYEVYCMSWHLIRRAGFTRAI